jgi:nucleotide-binding universal stress UspA family protein
VCEWRPEIEPSAVGGFGTRENGGVVDATPARILVLYENSRFGAAALDQAATLAAREGALLAVVVVAVTEPEDARCCDTRAGYWNGIVRELADEDLGRARALLRGSTAEEFRVVTARSIPTALAIEAQRFRADMILVPSARGFHRWSRSRRARQIQRRVRDAVVVAAVARRPA